MDTMPGVDNELMCPSARCQVGSKLLGIVGPEGVVGFVSPLLPVTDAFVEQVQSGRRPESRFRFTAPCVQKKCAYWTGERCGVVDAMVVGFAEQAEMTQIRPCALRSSCRWFNQQGRSACKVCPLVITDGTVAQESA